MLPAYPPAGLAAELAPFEASQSACGPQQIPPRTAHCRRAQRVVAGQRDSANIVNEDQRAGVLPLQRLDAMAFVTRDLV